VEEHNVIGGLGSIVAEELLAAGITPSLTKIGLRDQFTKGYGDIDTVRRKNGLDASTIAACIRKELR
jgi:transketolase